LAGFPVSSQVFTKIAWHVRHNVLTIQCKVSALVAFLWKLRGYELFVVSCGQLPDFSYQLAIFIKFAGAAVCPLDGFADGKPVTLRKAVGFRIVIVKWGASSADDCKVGL